MIKNRRWEWGTPTPVTSLQSTLHLTAGQRFKWKEQGTSKHKSAQGSSCTEKNYYLFFLPLRSVLVNNSP